MGVTTGKGADMARRMLEIGDGAFPNVFEAAGEQFIEMGISKRDWFAGQIAGHLFASLSDIPNEDAAADFVARMSYKTADAMLEARKK